MKKILLIFPLLLMLQGCFSEAVVEIEKTEILDTEVYSEIIEQNNIKKYADKRQHIMDEEYRLYLEEVRVAEENEQKLYREEQQEMINN